MKNLLILFVQLTLAYAAPIRYRKDAEFMIGAIIPLTKEDTNGNCTQINPEGVALAEAIVHGIERVNVESEFKELVKKKPFGYDIRDNCGKSSETNYIAFNMTHEAIMYERGKSSKVPVQVVISAFTKSDVQSLPVLSSRGITQMSYSKDNARLKKDAAISKDTIDRLISMYPGSTKKLLAVIDIIKVFGFNYVHGVATGNVEGAKALDLLSTRLGKINVCKSSHLFLSTAEDVNTTLDKIAENPKIRVVVVHCTKDTELALYKEAQQRNMTGLIFISTQNWHSDINSIRPYASVVEGMVYVNYKRIGSYLKDHLIARTLPYRNRDWIKRLFLGIGGNASCFTNPLQKGIMCPENEVKVRDLLGETEPVSVYAFQAVYAIAYALKKSEKDKTSLAEATNGLDVDIPVMALSRIAFNDDLSTVISKFKIYNIRGNEANKVENKWLGQWDERSMQSAHLHITKNVVRWKDGTGETPVSVCSDSCPPGFERSFVDQKRKCCWSCSKCPNGTASNITNSNTCFTCSEGHVVRPDQTGCMRYKLLYFSWNGPVGIIIVILMIISVILILFALGVFSHNSMHELVIHSNYNSLCFFLLACLILTITPIPLLITPTVSSCLAYIILLNVSISMVIGVLVSRSAYMNGLYDDNGELVTGTLGGYPRLVVVSIIVVLQIIINIVVYNMESLQVMHNLTEHWAERYHECSSWASLTFWIGFIYNVIVSVIGNSMSCSSTKMEDHSFELKYVLQSHLVFYSVALIELCVFFRSNDEHLAGGQGVICLLYAIGFYLFYIAPKLFIILFRSKGNKAIEPEADADEENAHLMTTAVHASAGFKHHGIVQMKVRDED